MRRKPKRRLESAMSVGGDRIMSWCKWEIFTIRIIIWTLLDIFVASVGRKMN